MKAPGYKPKLDLRDWQPVKKEEYEQILSIISPELHSFVEEHAALSQLMDKVREGYDETVYQQALHEIETELEQHFLYEERFILTRLKSYFATEEVGPVRKLLQEHRIIRNHYQDAAYLFANRETDNPGPDLIQKMNLLAYLLKKHIEKEDHYFFPMVSLILSQEEKAAIAEEVTEAYLRRAKA
ncbi:hemerythrin domain-containing protein [Brevibacillus humidisoli]|uniref:hemerythrin domain-containing protein n=1 Tax=Brevibacillus humidisoli TaxID=2895522 RepID=UPI001E45BA1C|nr:hemerythrin domain-containing protein [Brevibacillus humidisoli]UFJ41082.1 hemerythrin domain-containing protein [Brevibacillus humidisoli]